MCGGPPVRWARTSCEKGVRSLDVEQVHTIVVTLEFGMWYCSNHSRERLHSHMHEHMLTTQSLSLLHSVQNVALELFQRARVKAPPVGSRSFTRTAFGVGLK